MLRIGSQALSQTRNSALFSAKPLQRLEWGVSLFHRSGGLKKSWFVTQDDSPVTSLKFELNKHLCGAGTIDFAFLDFPLDPGDYITVSYNGELVYRAIIDMIPDVKGGKAKLIPFSQRFSELLMNDTFSAKTVSEILQTVIEDYKNDTTILWNSAFIDTGSTDTFTKDYSGYETHKKVIDESVNSLDDKEWGVNPSNVFTVYEPSSTVDDVLFYIDDAFYSEIQRTEDTKKVKSTREQTFKKVSGTGETTRIGQVGYDTGAYVPGSNWPILDIEAQIGRKKEKKFNVSEVISDNGVARDINYADLQANAIVPETIKVKDLRVDKYFPIIGRRIRVQDRPEYIMRTIIECDALTGDDNTLSLSGNWVNATIDTTTFVNGSGSCQFDQSDVFMDYNFSETVYFLKPLKIGFMIYADLAGNYLDVGLFDGTGSANWSEGNWSEGTWSASNSLIKSETISIDTGGVWLYKEIALPQQSRLDVKKIRFAFNDSTTATVNIDRIQLYMLHRNIYDGNIVQADFEISKKGTNCNVKLNDYDRFANDDIFRYEREIEKLEAIQQDT